MKILISSFFLFSLLINITTAQISTWNQNNAYTKGDIAINSGKNYKALQDVPAGTAITSSAYWQDIDETKPDLAKNNEIPAGLDTVTSTTPDITEIANLKAPDSNSTVPTTTPDTNTTTASTSRLINISTRGFVGTGDDVLIGGFVIKGTEPKKVLIRALGPSLTSKGVSGALNNPYLYVVNQATKLQVAVNTSWRTPIDSEDISSIIGDAIFEPGDENDAAMILTLNPGDYSAVVADEGGQTGISLIEVNEID